MDTLLQVLLSLSLLLLMAVLVLLGLFLRGLIDEHRETKQFLQGNLEEPSSPTDNIFRLQGKPWDDT